jgi:hypothetical protein
VSTRRSANISEAGTASDIGGEDFGSARFASGRVTARNSSTPVIEVNKRQVMDSSCFLLATLVSSAWDIPVRLYNKGKAESELHLRTLIGDISPITHKEAAPMNVAEHIISLERSALCLTILQALFIRDFKMLSRTHHSTGHHHWHHGRLAVFLREE